MFRNRADQLVLILAVEVSSLDMFICCTFLAVLYILYCAREGMLYIVLIFVRMIVGVTITSHVKF